MATSVGIGCPVSLWSLKVLYISISSAVLPWSEVHFSLSFFYWSPSHFWQSSRIWCSVFDGRSRSRKAGVLLVFFSLILFPSSKSLLSSDRQCPFCSAVFFFPQRWCSEAVKVKARFWKLSLFFISYSQPRENLQIPSIDVSRFFPGYLILIKAGRRPAIPLSAVQNVCAIECHFCIVKESLHFMSLTSHNSVHIGFCRSVSGSVKLSLVGPTKTWKS